MLSLHGVWSAMGCVCGVWGVWRGCLVATLLSITCPLTEINLGLFALRYAIKLSMGRCCEFQLGDG